MSINNYSNGNNVNIRSIPGLENSAAVLASCNQSISNNISRLKQTMEDVKRNWENSDGIDLNSVFGGFNKTINMLENEIQPLLKGYVNTLYNISAEMKKTQNTRMW